MNNAVLHMAHQHSFFIPNKEHLSDMSGLLSYLGEKIGMGNICLYCPHGGKEFGSLESVRKHMNDKTHCKMAYETDADKAEVSEFYEHPIAEDDSDWEDAEMVSGENESPQSDVPVSCNGFLF